MRKQPIVQDRSSEANGDQARERVLAGIPLTQRRLRLASVDTAVLEGGDGPPLVLLHGQGGWAAGWLPIIPDLVRTHRIVAPDLPGLGASETTHGPPDTATVLAWLDELIDATCTTPPVLVGASLGGSIAPRFAARHRQRLARLVLVDAGCLVGRVRPAPGVLLALVRHSLAKPAHHGPVARQVTVDLDGLRERLGERWEPFLAYSLDRARTPSVQQANRHLLRELGWQQIPPQDLERIAVPTTLIWGRQDRVMPLRTAREASARYGWPLQVIDDAGHFLVADQPEAFLAALQDALGDR
jgi:pimeloyl-ACP methyl ester carboxylesterase